MSCHFQGNHVSYGRRMLQAIDPETCNGLLDEYSLITSVDGDLCACLTTTGGNVELACEPVNQDDSRGCVISSNLVFIDLFDAVVEVTPEGIVVSDSVCIFVERLSFSGVSTEIGTVCIDFTNFYNSCEVVVDGIACTSCQSVECTLQGRGGGLQQYTLPSLDCRNLPTDMAGMWNFCDEGLIAPDLSNPLVAIDPRVYDYQTRCNANRAKPAMTDSPSPGTPPPVAPVPTDCSLCENGQPPPFPELVLQGETCGEINANIAGESEERCTAGRATFGVYCGCQNPIASEGACRVCGDNNLLPDPALVVVPTNVGGDCVNLEFTANVASEGISCVQAQTMDAASICCGAGQGPTPALPSTPEPTTFTTLPTSPTSLDPVSTPPSTGPTSLDLVSMPPSTDNATTSSSTMFPTTVPTSSDSISMPPSTGSATSSSTMLPTTTPAQPSTSLPTNSQSIFPTTTSAAATTTTFCYWQVVSLVVWILSYLY